MAEILDNIFDGRLPWNDGLKEARQIVIADESRGKLLVLRPGKWGETDTRHVNPERMGEELGSRKNVVSGEQAWKTLENEFKSEFPKLFDDYRKIGARIPGSSVRGSFENANTSISHLIDEFFEAVSNKFSQARNSAAEPDASALHARAGYYFSRMKALDNAHIPEPEPAPFPAIREFQEGTLAHKFDDRVVRNPEPSVDVQEIKFTIPGVNSAPVNGK